jgi:hypothetical protein
LLKIYALFGDTDLVDTDLVGTDLVGNHLASPFKLDSNAARQQVQRLLPSVCNYRQFFRSADQFEGSSPAPYVASAEFWMAEDEQDPLAETLLAIGHASDKLADVLTRDPQWVNHAVEHQILGRAMEDSGYKCTFLFNRKPTMSLAAFHDHWLHKHGPIAARTQDAERYVQSHFQTEDRRFDGITELFWADYPTAIASMGSEQMRTDQASDAQKFVDGDSLVMFLSAETT